MSLKRYNVTILDVREEHEYIVAAPNSKEAIASAVQSLLGPNAVTLFPFSTAANSGHFNCYVAYETDGTFMYLDDYIFTACVNELD